MRLSIRRIVSALLAAAVLAALASRQCGLWPAEKHLAVRGTVSRVYDGDTIEVEGVGKVRLLGIDTLDGFDPYRMRSQARWYGMTAQQVKHWADQASEFARERLHGKTVEVTQAGDMVDDYGRVLAYVHVDEEDEQGDFNLLMLKTGLAAQYQTATHPRRSAYFEAEATARAERRGLWQDAQIAR